MHAGLFGVSVLLIASSSVFNCFHAESFKSVFDGEPGLENGFEKPRFLGLNKAKKTQKSKI